MNLTKLFEAQRALDEHIIKEKGLEGQDLLPNLILALQVELGELANEWRGFKHWSNDRAPRTEYLCEYCKGTGFVRTVDHRMADTEEQCPGCVGGVAKEGNPLFEEYVDCLHFILCIGLHKGYEKVEIYHGTTYSDTTSQFLELFDEIASMHATVTRLNYIRIWKKFIGLGDMLGFTPEQIEKAYMAKNAINHQRQENGY